jgi:Tol biopolymer transport system component
MAVMLDGQRGPEYEVIGCWEPSVLGAGSPLFSPDSKRLAYMAARSEKQWVFVVDGVEGEPFDGFPIGQFLPGSRERNLFSPDSRRIAYAAGRGDKMHVVVDGKLSPLYETAGLEILFSPDSQHIAYSVKEKGRTHLVLDDDLGAAYDEIVGDPIFSNRNTFDYLARREGTLYRVSRAPRGHL